MTEDLLYSVNPHIKLLLQAEFFNNRHYCWCAEQWDSASRMPNTVSALVPPSSNPRNLHRILADAVAKGDRGDAKIKFVTEDYLQRGTTMVAAGTMAPETYAEMAEFMRLAQITEWRPMLYVIPKARVLIKLELVPLAKRAGLGKEYIVRDLPRGDFDLLEI